MCAWFVEAIIEKQANNCYTLRVQTTWFFVWKVEEFSVHTSLADAKAHLLDMRCKGHMTVKE